MYRFVLPLCLLLASFQLDVDPADAQACVRLRAMPDSIPAWCVQAPPFAPTVAHTTGATVRALGLRAIVATRGDLP